MRRVFVALAFCCCSLAMYGQKTRLGQGLPSLPSAKSGTDYPIKVHISGVHYREEYLEGYPLSNRTEEVIYADAVMNGKKVELREAIRMLLITTTNCRWEIFRRD